MNSDRVVTFTPSSIGSSSSFSSSKSSLFVLDDSQSDNSMPRGDISQYNIAASPSSTPSSASPQQPPFQSSIITSTASTTQKIKRAFGKRRKQSQDASSLLAVISPTNSPSLTNAPLSKPRPTESQSTPSSQPSSGKLSVNMFSAKKHSQANNHNNNYNIKLNPSTAHSSTSSSTSLLSNLSSSSHPPTQLQPQSQVQVHLPSHPAISETSHLPPLPPPKPRLKQPSNTKPSLPSSPSNMVAEYVRGVAPSSSDHPERSGTPFSASEETKERWRRSDSTMDSGHTVRPSTTTGTPSESRRVSAYLAGNNNTEDIDEEDILWEPGVQSRPPPSAPASMTVTPSSQRQERPSTAPDTPSKQVKRRSLSLTIPSTSSTQKHHASQLHHHHSHVSSSHASTNSVPFTSFASAANATDISVTTEGCRISPASIVIHPPKNNNIRGRLAAWAHPSHRTPSPSPSPIAQASTSSPSLLSTTSTGYSSTHIRTPLTSDASVTDLHAVGLVRQMQSRVRSPSSSSLSNSAGHIRQAATSLTNNASAMALGLGKKAYERVGRVWGGASSHTGSGSGSDTSSYHHPSPISGSPMQLYPAGQDRSLSHGPSAFNSRRSPNSSGSWSIPSQSQGSRSSSERDGRDTPNSFSSLASRPMGKLVRPPRAPSGLVFKRELWECVKDTKTVASSMNDPLASRMIPALIYRCVQHLHKWGLEEEGLFRISGRAGHVARLRNDFDGGADYDITDCPPSDLDPHAVASVFKAYLRELPDVILTRSLSPLFDNAINTENSRTSAAHLTGKATSPASPANMNMVARAPQALRKPPSLSTFTLPTSSTLRAPSTVLINIIRDLISRLPKENYDLLLTVVELIRATAAKSSITKMPLSNLLLVFCPSLSMSPTLLRVLCDVPSVWEGTPEGQMKTSTKLDHLDGRQDQADEGESLQDKADGAVYSDALSEDDNGQNTGEKETIKCRDEDNTEKNSIDLDDVATEEYLPKDETVSRSYEPSTGLEISADEDVILIPYSKTRENKHWQQTQRVPVPALSLQEVKDEQSGEGSQAGLGSSSSSSISEGDQTLPHSDSMTSLHSSESMEQPNSNSQTVSQVSLLSSEGDADVETGMSLAIRVPNNTPRFHRSSPNQSPKPSSPLTEQHYNFDKALPASPRTPTSISAFSAALTARRAATPPLEYAMTSIHGAGHKANKSSHSKQRRMDRVGSLSSPSLLGSTGASAPSIVFPSIDASSNVNAVQAPVPPTALKKLTISLAQRNSKTLDNITSEEDSPSTSPSPSKRMGRRPSLNLLFNMKHGSSGSTSSSSPRSRTPTISGPILFQNVGGGGEWEEVLPPSTIANTVVVSDTPPTLSLGMDSGESSLGWEDVFRVSTTQDGSVSSPPSSGSLSLPRLPPVSFAASVQTRPVAISQRSLPIHQSQSGSMESQLLQPTSSSVTTMASHRPTTEYLLSSNDFFSTNSPPEKHAPATVLTRADGNPDDTYLQTSPTVIDSLLSASAEGSMVPDILHDKANTFQGHDLSFPPKGLEAGSGSTSLSLQSSSNSPPPHINFHLRGSSFEEDDWASAVLSITSGGDKGFD